MKVVILAGGRGTRLSEETDARPKPMVEIGGKPLLWHIMKIYSYYGFNDFIICLGYKGYMIKEYFANYYLRYSDITVSPWGEKKFHDPVAEPWKVTLVDTGEDTLTGGRLRRIRKYLDDETFMLTYGDGVADIDIPGLLAHHQDSGELATVTVVRPAGRFGGLTFDKELKVKTFKEKGLVDAWINGGFFVLEPGIFNCIDHDDMMWEHAPLEEITRLGQLNAWPHTGFWQCMDTMRDKVYLEELWKNGAPWKIWK